LPNFWAHRICADITLRRLEGSPAAELIKRNEASYRLGSQGADMMYFRPTQLLRGKRGVVYHAKLLHAQPIEKLAAMSRKYLAGPAGQRQFSSTFSYICGFLCHHAVDQKVHPMIEARVVSVLKHRRIELDFDAFLSNELHVKHDEGNAHWTGMGEFAEFAGLSQWYNYMFHGLCSRNFSMRSYIKDYKALRRASVFLDKPRRLQKAKHTERAVLTRQELNSMLSAALQGCWNAADLINRLYCDLDLGAQTQARSSRLIFEPAPATQTAAV
jgi:hypothetical protein